MNNCMRGQAPARTNMQDVEAAGFGFVSEVASRLFLLYLDHLKVSTNLAAIKLNAMPGPPTPLLVLGSTALPRSEIRKLKDQPAFRCTRARNAPHIDPRTCSTLCKESNELIFPCERPANGARFHKLQELVPT
jgi:hypothetical protein